MRRGIFFLQQDQVAEANPKDEATNPCARPLRADAQRNRESLLAAAEAIFATEGIAVPVDVIAEKAGVGVGTLYRHFPTKEKLCEAILIERMHELINDAWARLDSDDPGAAFFGFIEHFSEQGVAKRDLIAALSGTGVEFELTAADAKQALREAVENLLVAAQRAGAVRPDVTCPVVLSLIGSTCMASERPYEGEATTRDLLKVICDGLRVPQESPGASGDSIEPGQQVVEV